MGRERWLAGLHREREKKKKEQRKEWVRKRELAWKVFCNFKIFLIPYLILIKKRFKFERILIESKTKALNQIKINVGGMKMHSNNYYKS
jgi:hypothetical protein